MQGEIGQARVFPAGQGLGRTVGLPPARFQQAHPQGLARQFPGQGDARGPGADNAQIRRDLGRRGELAGINQQAAPP